MAVNVVVAYDIAADGDRAKVAAVLSRWGDRIQKSVFACTLSTDELDEVLARIEKTMKVDHDVVHVFFQCASCADQERLLGQAESFDVPRYWVV